MTCALCEPCTFADATGEVMFHEIHLTFTGVAVPEFKSACDGAGVKLLVVNLQQKNDVTGIHLMTSETLKNASDVDVFARAIVTSSFIAAHCKTARLVRTKIETVPWHRAALDPRPGQYFESHLKMQCDLETVLRLVRPVAAEHNVHVSSNAFKEGVFMATVRASTEELVREKMRHLSMDLKNLRVEHDPKPIVEFTLFDSNVELDRKWTGEH